MAESNIAWFGLIGAIVGAVPALIGAVVPWLRDRDRIAKDRRAMELAKLAKLEVEFISNWIDAALKLPGEEMEAKKAIARERLYRLLSSGTRAELEPSVAVNGGLKVKGRTAFLVYLGFYCFMVFGMSIDDANNVSLIQLVNELRGDGVWALLIFSIPLPVLLVRWRLSAKRAKSPA